MSIPEKAGATLRATASREELTNRHRALETSLQGLKTADAINGLTQALRFFEDQSRTQREQLLKTGHAKTRDEQLACSWVAERYDHLLRLSRETVSRSFAENAQEKNLRAQICALAILLSGHVIKWRKFSGTRPDPTAREWLHQILRTALSFGEESTVLAIRIEERSFDATVESLYVRALLLDRFASGNLPPGRLEILDNWLVMWMGSLWLTRAPAVGEPTLGINTATPLRGLVPYVSGDESQLFLSLRPLQRQLDRTIRSFHHGKVFPQWGIGVNAPMEEHVAVIDFLEREFALIESARLQRSKRLAISTNSIVGVYFGFDEICGMAFSPERMHTLGGGGTNIGIRNAVNLVDISDGGLGLDMVDDDSRKVHVGDLLAVRLEKGRPCVLGMVVRKSTLQRPTATLIGIKVLSKAPVHVAMERVDATTNTWQPTQGILLAGLANNGYADSVIVSESTYVANALMAVSVGGQPFEMRLRRVRHQGPGWRMAAFDAARPE
jgi:hypothetical protein